MTALTFQAAADLYQRKLKRSRIHGVADVRIATNTFLGPRGDFAYAVRFHATDIVTIHADDTYTLTTGGWLTPTTKARIQEYAPLRIASVGGLWYLRTAQNDPYGYVSAFPYLFYDGIRVDDIGVPVKPIHQPTGKRFVLADVEKAKRALDRQVKKYIAGFAAHIAGAHGLEQPSDGDCWGCAMREAPHAVQAVGKEATAEPMGLDHYRSHFEEGYYVPSLLANAILEKGYPNPGYIWHDIIRDAERGQTSYLLTNALRSFFTRRKPAMLGLTDTVPVKTGPVTDGQAIGASRARARFG